MTAIKTETRGRKFNASRYAIVRAWEIANNAAVAHNTNPINLAKSGQVKATDFFAESLKIAWVEAKAKLARNKDVEMYSLHTVPKKTRTKILNALEMLNAVKASIGEVATKEEAATEVFAARFSTPSARSRNRHILAALADISESGVIPKELEKESTYAV